jgi:hypothetical protein
MRFQKLINLEVNVQILHEKVGNFGRESGNLYSKPDLISPLWRGISYYKTQLLFAIERGSEKYGHYAENRLKTSKMKRKKAFIV